MTNVTNYHRGFVEEEIDETKAVRYHALTGHITFSGHHASCYCSRIEKRDIVNGKYSRERVINAEKIILVVCEKEGISIEALKEKSPGLPSRIKGTIGQRTDRESWSYHGRNATAIRRNDFRHFEDI